MAGRETTELKIVYASCLQSVVLPSFWNYFHDKKKLFSQTQYKIREAVEGDKEAKVSGERDKVVQEMAMF